MLKKGILALSVLLVACGVQNVKKEASVPQKAALVADGFIIRDNINVRQSPKVQSTVVAKLNDGTPVVIRDNQNGWYQIETADDKHGWVRSDFVGPEMLSYAKLTEKFHAEVLSKRGVTIYIDEKKPYAVIYLVLKKEDYASRSKALKTAKKIVRLYQKQVYPGKVEVRVMQRDRQTLFAKKNMPAIGPVGLKAPFLRYGRLFSLTLKKRHLKIKVLVPAGLKNKQLLKMAREITGGYGTSIHRVDVIMVTASAAGKSYFKTGQKPVDSAVCRVHYFEDANGEDYRFNFCK